MIYLDYMASTPLDPRVISKMHQCLALSYANPAAQHQLGWQAAQLIENARQQVADFINADSREIVWTSGATEANNLALKGAAFFYQRKGRHIITTAVEHPSVLNTCAYLESQGFTVSYLRPDRYGIIKPAALTAAIRPDTILVSILWVNNETGVIQDIQQMSQLVRRQGIIFHVDAVQAAGRLAIDMRALDVDLLSLSAHKIYGPKGVGALYVRQNPRVRLQPQLHGGEQERGLRSGTLATHQIAGMGMACTLAQQQWDQDQQQAAQLGEHLWRGLQSIDNIELNGHLNQRVPHCWNVCIAGIAADTLLQSLPDLAISMGSACHSAYSKPSHVLSAMGLRPDKARSSLRFSLGRFTTVEEIDSAVAAVAAQARQLRLIVAN